MRKIAQKCEKKSIWCNYNVSETEIFSYNGEGNYANRAPCTMHSNTILFYELLIFTSVYVIAGLLWIIVKRKKNKQ